MRFTALGLVAAASMAAVACGSGSATSAVSSPAASPAAAAFPVIPPVTVAHASISCSLITAADVTAAAGQPAGAPVPAGDRPGAGTVPTESGCTVPVGSTGAQLKLTVERYATSADARARFDPIAARSDSQAVAGVADGAYVQQPPVSAGLLHGTDYVSVEGVPRTPDDAAASAAYTAVLRAVTTHFDSPAAGGGPRALIPADFDPCAFAVPLGAHAPVTGVMRITSETPPMAECRIALGGSQPLAVRVSTLTEGARAQLAAGTTLEDRLAALRPTFASPPVPFAGLPDTLSEPGHIAGIENATNEFTGEVIHVLYLIVVDAGSRGTFAAQDEKEFFAIVLKGWQIFGPPENPDSRYHYFDPDSGRWYYYDGAGNVHVQPAGQM